MKDSIILLKNIWEKNIPISNRYKKLDFDKVRIKVINFYNNKKNRLIRIAPMEGSKITDEESIKKLMI